MRQVLGLLALIAAGSAAAASVFRQAENNVQVAMVKVTRTAQYTQVELQTLQALKSVCWTYKGANSSYLLARDQRFHFTGGDNITACPARQDYAQGAIMVLRFEPVPADVREISLVEGEGGENQMVHPGASKERYWNFLHVPLGTD